MNFKTLGLILVFILFSSFQGFNSSFYFVPVNASSQQSLTTIVIDGNDNFTLIAQSESWSGNGSSSSPFVLSSLAQSAPLILNITNTTKYFKIENYNIQGSFEFSFYFANVSNGFFLNDIFGFFLSNNYQNITFTNCSNFTLNNLFFSSSWMRAFNISNSFQINILNSKIENSVISLVNTSACTISNSFMYQINLFFSKNISVFDNIFDSGNGLFLNLSKDIIIGHNKFTNGDYTAVEFHQCDNLTITYNTINYTAYFAIYSGGYNSSNIVISNNNFYNIWGFSINNIINSSIVNNKVSANFNNFGSGFSISGSNDLIYANSISNTIANGLNIAGDFNRISNNTISQNQGSGIVLFVNNSIIANNNIYSNSLDGISLLQGLNNTISRNKIYFNNGSGIQILNSSYTSVQNNEIFDNLHNGMNINNSLYIDVENNTIFDNNGFGILVTPNQNSNYDTITNNTLYNNLQPASLPIENFAFILIFGIVLCAVAVIGYKRRH